MRKVFFHRLFLLGIAAFWLPKLLAILLQTQAMDQPRLGDDALQLLWRGEQINVMGLASSMAPIDETSPRALRDIIELCPPAATYDLSTNQNWCERIAVRVARPHVFMGTSLLTAALLGMELDLKWTFMVYEALILTMAALGFAYLLLRAVGPSAAGIGLSLLAFVNVSAGHGLHQFVPSVLVTGLSMGLWGTLIGCRSWKGTVPALIGFPLLAWAHPIALLFAGGGVLVILGENREAWSVRGVAKIAGAGVLALAAIVGASETVRGVLVTELTQDLLGNIGQNLARAPTFFANFGFQNLGLAVLLVTASILWKRAVNREAAVIGAALLVLMALSLLHITSSYRFIFPLSLFARFFVCFLVIAAGVAGRLLLSIGDGKEKWRLAAVAGAAIVALGAGAPTLWDHSWKNVNGRPSAVDIEGITEGLAVLPKEATIAYGEMDVTVPSVLLAGGHDKGAIPALGLELPRLITALNDRRPAAVAVPLFRRLNTFAYARHQGPGTRQYGITGKYYDKVIIDSSQQTIVKLSLKVANLSDTVQTIGPNTVRFPDGSGKGKNFSIPSTTIPARLEKWIALDMQHSADIRRVILTLPDASVWIKGVLVNEEPMGLVHWPWSTGATVSWHLRGADPTAGTTLVFTPESLLKRWRAPPILADVVRAENPILSDRGGIVLMATRYDNGG